MEFENYVMIPIERYEQLIRAEHDANQLKSLIADAYENYAVLDRAVLGLLHKLYFGNKEETK